MISYNQIKEETVTGRYVTHEHIAAFLEDLPTGFILSKIGSSVKNRPIHSITAGTGPISILMWSQMHGNESTTTKALLDLINFLGQDSAEGNELLERCTLVIIPILNPDGAAVYTRVNANQVDLNRDAQDLTQPESKLLRKIYNTVKPDVCLNLHGQRTIFNVGETKKPATVSFLAPAHDEERTIAPSRKKSMQIIAAMDKELQKIIPNHIARYDDSFNANCVGDTFQMLGTPTILFEAGHFGLDYQREKTREFIFNALYHGINAIASASYEEHTVEEYFQIPENNKLFFDFLIKDAQLLFPKAADRFDVGVLYREKLEEGELKFIPHLEQKGNLNKYYGHITYDCTKEEEREALEHNENLFEAIKNGVYF